MTSLRLIISLVLVGVVSWTLPGIHAAKMAAGGAAGAAGGAAGAAGAAGGAGGAIGAAASGGVAAAGGGDAMGTMIKVMCNTKAEKAAVDIIMGVSNKLDADMGCLHGKMAKLEGCWKTCWMDKFGSSGGGPPKNYADKQKFFCGGNLDPTAAAKQLMSAMTCCANNTIKTFSEVERSAAKNACGLPVAYFDMTNGMASLPPMPPIPGM